MSFTRSACRTQSVCGVGSGAMCAPPSLTRIVAQFFQAVSRPRLSYTPPSVRRTSVVYGGCWSPLPLPFSKLLGSSVRCAGDNTGGNADDAPTATARSTVGFLINPTCQSAMYGFAKRHRDPVCTFVALMTKSGAGETEVVMGLSDWTCALPRTLVIAPVLAWRLAELAFECATESRFRLVADVGGDVGNAS